MKQDMVSLIAATVLCCIPAFSQEQKAPPAKHKVVFELNAPAPSGWDQLFHNVVNVRKIFGSEGVQVEIVFFGKGLRMLASEDAASVLKTWRKR